MTPDEIARRLKEMAGNTGIAQRYELADKLAAAIAAAIRAERERADKIAAECDAWVERHDIKRDALHAAEAERDAARRRSADAMAERDRLHALNTEVEADRNELWQRVSSITADRDRLRDALERAREDMQSWGSYASAYFQDKHDLAGDLAAIDAALRKTDTLPVGGTTLNTERT